MNISVIGAGYVGLSIANLLSVKNKVKIYDIDKNKIDFFKKDSELIITNRMSDELAEVLDKVYTIDVYNNN